MTYDAWKTRSDWDDRPELTLPRGEAEVDPEEAEAESEHRQNIQNLLEQEEPGMGEEQTATNEEIKAWASLSVEDWLRLAGLEELIELRDRINTMIGARVPSVTKTRKPRSDKGQSNPKRGRKRS